MISYVREFRYGFSYISGDNKSGGNSCDGNRQVQSHKGKVAYSGEELIPCEPSWRKLRNLGWDVFIQA